jgi:hypothetical protein
VSRRRPVLGPLRRGTPDIFNRLAPAWFRHDNRQLRQPAHEREVSEYVPRRPEAAIGVRVVWGIC